MLIHRSRRKKIVLRRLLFVGIIFAVLGCGYLGYRLFSNQPRMQTSNSLHTTSTVQNEKQKLPASPPARLVISSIHIDTTVAPAGLQADGSMDIKKDPDQTAWYQFGARPGDEGSAVIAGHYGWNGLHGSVFNELHTLLKGDKISVIDQAGLSRNFIVSRIEKFNPSADTSNIFQSYDGKAHLNLITCEGEWINSKNTYSDRLVVFTDLE